MKSSNYTEKDITTNLLCSLKHLKALYSYFAQEASCTPLFDVISELYDEITQLQRNTYDIMIEENWYSVQAQTTDKIKKAYTKYEKAKSELS